jgi:hypothetical protein
MDISGTRRAEGPDTLVLRTRDTALADNLGLARVLDRLNLCDLLTVNASPDLEDFNVAFGFDGVLPSFLRPNQHWAHFLTASVQLERRSPREAEPETSGLAALHAYWGHAWAWHGQYYREALKEVERAVDRTTLSILEGGGPLGNPALIEVILASAGKVDWLDTPEENACLEDFVGPAAGRYVDVAGDEDSLKRFLTRLAGALATKPEWQALSAQVGMWSDNPESFLSRLREVLVEEADLRGFELSEEEVGDAQVSLANLTDTVDPSALAIYHGLLDLEEGHSGLSEEVRDVVAGAFMEAPGWWRHDLWQKPIFEHVAEQTMVWKPRWSFALDVAAYQNWGSDTEPAALLDARLTWRPDPFQPYGLTLSHKQGKEESNRDRQVDQTSLEVSYKF